jgi:hypothetical protein
VTDAYPLPRVEDIIADAGKGRIWSVLDMTNSFFHIRHVKLVMDRLRKDGLCLNEKKSMFFITEVDFLGHHISERGVEAQKNNVERILKWP